MVSKARREELVQVARDYINQKIFSDRHIGPNDQNLAMNIFLPFALMEKKDADRLHKRGVAMIYEYLDKAGSRSINGYPMFMSFRLIYKDEWPIFYEAYQKIDAVAKEAKAKVEEIKKEISGGRRGSKAR